MTQILLTYLNFGYLTSASHVGRLGIVVFKSFTWITKISFELHLRLLRWENNILVYNQGVLLFGTTKPLKQYYPFFNLQPFIDIYVHTTTKPTTKSLITDNIDPTYR